MNAKKHPNAPTTIITPALWYKIVMEHDHGYVGNSKSFTNSIAMHSLGSIFMSSDFESLHRGQAYIQKKSIQDLFRFSHGSLCQIDSVDEASMFCIAAWPLSDDSLQRSPWPHESPHAHCRSP